jgi:hypothetical protein
MTQTTHSTAQAALLLTDHLKEYAQFLEVKEKVSVLLEELRQSGRIVKYRIQDRKDVSLYVVVDMATDVPKEVRRAVMWELSDLGIGTGVLVDAFTQTVNDEVQSAQDDR